MFLGDRFVSLETTRKEQESSEYEAECERKSVFPGHVNKRKNKTLGEIVGFMLPLSIMAKVISRSGEAAII